MKLLRASQNFALLLSLSLLLCLPAHAAKKTWASLTPMQQEALAPIVQQWESMPEMQQIRLLATTKRYPKLTPKQKQLYLANLTEWSKLTPEQRNRAREKYKAFSKVTPEKRDAVKQMVLQSEAEKMGAAASGVERIPEVAHELEH